MRDPVADLEKFRSQLDPEPVIGDIWWLPKEHVGSLKQPPNDAFCLMVAAETDRSGEIARLHYVAGTTKKGGGATPSIEVAASEGGLSKQTRFRFYGSRDLDPVTIKADGTWRDRLPTDRMAEIATAIRASKLIKLKRILDG